MNYWPGSIAPSRLVRREILEAGHMGAGAGFPPLAIGSASELIPL
jgi:hypothetical protein